MSVIRNLFMALTWMAKPWARIYARAGYFHFAPPEGAPGRVGILACHWLGDTLWAAQVMPLLRKHWPDTELVVMTKSRNRDLWQGALAADRILITDAVVSDRRRESVNWSALRCEARTLRAEAFDLVLDLTGNRYSSAFTFLMRPHQSIGFDGGEWRWIYSHRIADAVWTKDHLSERPFHVLTPLFGDGKAPEELLPPESILSFSEACKTVGFDPIRPVIVVAPGAGWAEKEWPAAKFAEVIARMLDEDQQVVLTGTASEEPLCAKIVQQAQSLAKDDREKPRPSIFCGAPLSKVIGLLCGVRAYLGNDSGLGHVAAALGRRTVVIFTGATDPLRCGPKGKDVTILHTDQRHLNAEDVWHAMRDVPTN